MIIIKGKLYNKWRNIWINENKARIEFEQNGQRCNWFFVLKGRHYKIYDNQEKLKLFSELDSSSKMIRFLGIAPVVFYDDKHNEIIRINNHKSFGDHKIIINKIEKHGYDWRRKSISWNYGEAKFDAEEGVLNFECQIGSLYQALAISVVLWYNCNGPQSDT